MARKIVFDDKIILEKAYEFIKEKGIESMNARDLCKYIGCSTQPLFKNFGSMTGMKVELKDYLHNYYDDFIYKIVNKDDYLATISYAYALFALKEANIFKALFMSDLAGSRTIEQVLTSKHNIETIESIIKQYNLTKEKSEILYRDVRFYTHGLACQIACNSILVKENDIKKMIKDLIENLRV